MKNKKSPDRKNVALSEAERMNRFYQMAIETISLMQWRTEYAERKVRDLEKILRSKDLGVELELSLDKVYSLETEIKSLQRELQKRNKIARK